MTSNPVLTVHKLTKLFDDSRRIGAVSVGVRGVSFQIDRGEAVGLIGESGCGKTTLGRCIVGLENADSGDIVVDGTTFSRLSPTRLRSFRRAVQIVFQRPENCLNPRMSVATFVSHALKNFGMVAGNKRPQRLLELVDLVGLKPESLERFPHQLSGGERQRVAIMRALACEPSLIVLDEPTSALDVSVQAQVLATLKTLQADGGTSFLFISHDVAVVRYICSRVMVMYLGTIVEEGPTEIVLSKPAHPYTQALFAAAPRLTPRPETAQSLKGELVLSDVQPGECPVRARCPEAHDRCHRAPPVTELSKGHYAACWLAKDTVETQNPSTE